jgi:Raf kinase inhibitor-like YbhB/YbcL family protein
LKDEALRVPHSLSKDRHHSLASHFALTLALLVASFLLFAFRSRTSVAMAAPAPGGTPMSWAISSPSFSNGGNIPKKFTCDGPDLSPQLAWTEAPDKTKTLALLVDDPDAPVGNWNHWTMWNAPATLRGLPEGVSKNALLPDSTEQGINDFRKIGYNGPCPPAGKPHRYYFKLFALDTKLDLKPDSGKKELEAAMKGHVVVQAELMGTYGR